MYKNHDVFVLLLCDYYFEVTPPTRSLLSYYNSIVISFSLLVLIRIRVEMEVENISTS